MQTFSDFERQRDLHLKQKDAMDMECVHCPRCQSQWFTEVGVHKYMSNHNLIIGQHVPVKSGSVTYFMLKCVRCDNLLEPRIIYNTRDIGGSDYDDFLDTLDGKGDARSSDEDLKEVIKGLKARIELLEQGSVSSKEKKSAVQGKKQQSIPTTKQ